MFLDRSILELHRFSDLNVGPEDPFANIKIQNNSAFVTDGYRAIVLSLGSLDFRDKEFFIPAKNAKHALQGVKNSSKFQLEGLSILRDDGVTSSWQLPNSFVFPDIESVLKECEEQKKGIFSFAINPSFFSDLDTYLKKCKLPNATEASVKLFAPESESSAARILIEGPEWKISHLVMPVA